MISLDTKVAGFGGIGNAIDRLEIVSFSYHREPGREPHLDIGVRVGLFCNAVHETIESEHSGWRMNDAGPTRTCHDCAVVERWIEAPVRPILPAENTGDGNQEPETLNPEPLEGRWSGEHDMEACLAAKTAESREISAAHIDWFGGTSIIVKGDQLEGLGIGSLESAVGGLIHLMAVGKEERKAS
ncbi:MAG: hypothetical protein AABN33_18485 [Acidobacteriota bacterium]